MTDAYGATPTDDAHWVEQARAGSTAAFAELVRRYRLAAYAAAYAQVRDHTEAEDAVQEAFIAAHRSLASIRQPDRFGVWVCRIAARTAGHRRKRRQRETERSRDLAQRAPVDSVIEPWEALAAGELREAVRGLVQELSRPNREAIELHYLHGYAVREIAGFLDVPVGTVKRRLYDGRRKLRALLVHAVEPELLDDILPEGRDQR